MNRVLICGPNWLGDGIMSMPAVQAFKTANPQTSISVLVKKGMMPLWQMCAAVDDVLELESGFVGTIRTAETLNRCRFSRAYIFPNSFRSAFIPFLGGVAERRGVLGHHRTMFINDVVHFDHAGKHQSSEYFELLGIDEKANVLPKLTGSDDAEEIRKRHLGAFAVGKKVVAMIPGAAFGAAKMWPSENFVNVGRRFIEQHNCRVLVMGTESERDVCIRISEELGESALCLAAETSLHESVVLFGDCSFVITNDSGGMHLAAASGAKVIALFGVTDPQKTGPLGEGHKLVIAEGVDHDRDLTRDSEIAIAAMRSIEPDRVYQAGVELLK